MMKRWENELKHDPAYNPNLYTRTHRFYLAALLRLDAESLRNGGGVPLPRTRAATRPCLIKSRICSCRLPASPAPTAPTTPRVAGQDHPYLIHDFFTLRDTLFGRGIVRHAADDKPAFFLASGTATSGLSPPTPTASMSPTPAAPASTSPIRSTIPSRVKSAPARSILRSAPPTS